jgi:phosphoglycolate phosphatase-like HAD superfamily hydrolase
MKYLLLFDIDGTILKFKSYKSKEIFSNMMLDIFGVEVPDSAMPDFAGMTDLQILKEIAQNIGMDKSLLFNRLNEIWLRISQDYNQFCSSQYIDLLPGIKELLKLLSNNQEFSLGLQTGNFKENAYSKLSAYNLDNYFQFGAFGSDHENRNMLPPLAIERANQYHKKQLFHTYNTLVIGDSHKDIECAKSNNLPVLAVGTGNVSAKDLEFFEPSAVLDDFSNYNEVIDLIYKILKRNNEKY